MSNFGAGHRFPPQPVSWLRRDVLLFANSIGATADELHFLYELHPNFAVFPTYSIILQYKKTSQEVIDFYASQKAAPIPGAPKLDYTRVVDGQQSIEFFKPLPTSSEGRRFELRQKVIGIYDKGKAGAVLERETLLVDADSDEAYAKIIGSLFFVGGGGFGGDKGPPTIHYPPPKDRQPNAVFVLQTSPETAHLYRLNGDYNPLHATPEPGQKLGFGGAILHGLFSWNSTAHGVLKTVGGSDPANLKQFQARFASPVKPGDKLVTEIWKTGNVDAQGYEEVRFQTKVEGGKVCLSNGRALVRTGAPITNKL